ncbi:OLC1v1035420C1 [Oldenlandia corymbosa var. corymbosa]|uniref:OLC1v1035420C1 n=1 Tax=Oldenlandia corymbosa var. corymbosa TaxID=529605 RepID=A0AAV1CT05_OLDCO|nr:OLC1v1035420C1 [Oldenlandia corymbosa var. corymbosa]
MQVGNALFDDFRDHLGRFQFMWASGLISDQTFKKLNLFCDFQLYRQPSEMCDKILEIADNEIGDIDLYSIFTPPSGANFSMLNPLMRRQNVSIQDGGHLRRQYDPCTEQHSTIYFNVPEVQRALHVYNRDSSSKWAGCSDEVNSNWKDSPHSVLDIYRELIPSGIRIWAFRIIYLLISDGFAFLHKSGPGN